ncbi:MAG TPA: hypothetical protein VIY52_25330 [Streptosporangiaceae bacterium]
MSGPTQVRAAASAPPRVRAAWPTIVVVLVVAVLFFLYLRQSLITPMTSDGAANVLQAQSMLHGNLLLHDWWVSDVSFYPTELSQYALIEAVLGLSPWVVHVAAAMTYTLLVVLSALLARGSARGRVGLARALVAAGIILSPQVSATQIVLLQPQHAGTSVPLLVAWLLIDRAPQSPGPRNRWLTPVVVCVILGVTAIADASVLLTGIIPLVLVCLVRACPGVMRGARTEPRWYELSLAGAGAVAGLGFLAPRAIAALGGYREWPVLSGAGPITFWARGAKWTFQGVLELFGADFYQARPGIEVAFAVVHLVGAILVIGALLLALARFFRFTDLLIPVFAVGIVLNLGAYLTSPRSHGILSTREIAGVLALGAVLAGRVLGERVLAMVTEAKGIKGLKGWSWPVLAVVAAGYLGGLAYAAAQPAAPPAHQPLASFLAAHGLTDGLAGYWQASSTTVDSGGRVLVSGVAVDGHGHLVPYQWETDDSDYARSRHHANFVVADGPLPLSGAWPAALRTFGRPQRVYRYDGYTIGVWDTNLLRRL